MRLYLTCIRNTLEAAMCLQVHDVMLFVVIQIKSANLYLDVLLLVENWRRTWDHARCWFSVGIFYKGKFEYLDN